jgi:hypothetical protein
LIKAAKAGQWEERRHKVRDGSLPVLASEPPDVLLSQRTWPWMVVWIAAVAVIFGLIGAPLIHLIR